MASKTGAVATPTAAERTNRDNERPQPVLLLETINAPEPEPLILLDQATTHLYVSQSPKQQPGRIAIYRSELGWNLRSHGANCRLNGIPVEDVWLYDGDQLTISDTEFQVRAATTEELLGQLPQAGAQAPANQNEELDERTIAVVARERDLAEWEQCLSECESDLRIRTARARHNDSSTGESPIDPEHRSLRAQFQDLRTNPTAFEEDRQRLQNWLTTLQQERAAVQQERERLDADRALLADCGPQATIAVTPPSLSTTIAAAVSAECPPKRATFENQNRSSADATSESESGPIGMEWHRPRRNLEQSRLRLNSLRAVANHSARRALTHHFWRQHRSAVVLKATLVGMSFGLACVLYWHHGAMGSSISAVVWAAAAIGLITLSGLVHTWTEVSRLNARFRPTGANETLELAEAKASGLLSGT